MQISPMFIGHRTWEPKMNRSFALKRHCRRFEALRKGFILFVGYHEVEIDSCPDDKVRDVPNNEHVCNTSQVSVLPYCN